MLISDFGLCKKLDVDQTSFLPTAQGAMAAGTVGWRAPEILRGEVKLDDAAGDDSQSSRGSSVGTPTNSSGGGGSCKPTRLTKLVDIFALGCLFYYTLTNGGHPFGDRFEREVNILKDVRSLGGLERFGEEGSEAVGLISSMLSTEASHRYVIIFHGVRLGVLMGLVGADLIQPPVCSTRFSGTRGDGYRFCRMPLIGSRSCAGTLEIPTSTP